MDTNFDNPRPENWKVRMRKLISEMSRLGTMETIEGPTDREKTDLSMVGLACYSPEGLTYISYGIKPGLTRDEVVKGLRKQMEELDDSEIDEDAHRFIMDKAKAYGEEGHEVITGVTISQNDQGQNIVRLHFPEDFSQTEAARIIKQAAFKTP